MLRGPSPSHQAGGPPGSEVTKSGRGTTYSTDGLIQSKYWCYTHGQIGCICQLGRSRVHVGGDRQVWLDMSS